MTKRRKYVPILFLIIYMTTIVVFTIIYYCLEESFIHSTLIYEESFSALENDLLYQLQDEIIDNLSDGNTYSSEDYSISANTVDVKRIDYDETTQKIIIHFSCELTDYPDNDELEYMRENDYIYLVSSYQQFELIFPDFEISSLHDIKTMEKYNLDEYVFLREDGKYLVLYNEIIQSKPDVDVYIKGSVKTYDMLDAFGTLNGEFAIFHISEETCRNLITYQEAMKGKGDLVKGRFIRMLYFSSVTITTLGFGDIVPVTNLARVLVGIESILGIVILGFMVNSVFQKSR